MLLDVKKVTEVGASPAVAFEFLRDVPRLSACIPKVTDLQEVTADREYTAVVADKLGPFGLQVPVRIEVQEVEEPRRILAALTGDDKKGAARMRGSLEAVVEPKGEGSELHISMQVEVLGKLAALGAAPMRRRADEIFNQFTVCLRERLGASTEAGAHG